MVANYLLNVNYIYSILAFNIYGIFTIFVAIYNPTFNELLKEIIIFVGIIGCSGLILFYMDEHRNRLNYLDQQKIKRLLIE